ncbi:type IV pilus biogenesis protein PilM [Candidatus Proelusimicrobium volucris]|uniref:type IV pilus biogenesis protein PilM n=1 Tax=Candidatus Proelusimicrobium volucris TaxID=3416225 RepID=UPI003D10B742
MSFASTIDSSLGIKRTNYKECIGIYISLTDVYVAQVREKSGGLEIDSLIKLPVGEIPPGVLKPADLNEGFFSTPKHWLDPIKKIIDSKQWATKNVVVTLASNFSIHRHFVMQDTPRRYWKNTIPLQARKYIHYPFERGVSDYYVYPFYAGLSKAKHLGVVFSMTSARIVQVLEAGMKSIGLNLVAVETSPISIYRLFNQTDKENVSGKGCIYANFTAHTGQFLYALNNAPVLMREVEVQKAIGNRNRLEVNNCMDFISKQIEKNPFEDVVVISDEADFWAPILESEVKRHVRTWKISDIFGFKVEGFAEMAAIGACLKFVNKNVPDIDLYRKNRSSDEEIRSTITVWKLALMLVALLIIWCGFVQVRAVFQLKALSAQTFTSTKDIPDFEGLYASQIKERVSAMSRKAKSLSTYLEPVNYTEKLSVLPDILPPEMWLTELDIRYPYNTGASRLKEKSYIRMEGVASVVSGREKELALGNRFRTVVDSTPEMADLCKGRATISYDFSTAPLKQQQKDFVLGTKFSLKCEKEDKK